MILSFLGSTFYQEFINAYIHKYLSSFFDFHLQPLVQGVKYYIKDTNHSLNKIKKDSEVTKGSNPLYYGCSSPLP